MLLTNFLTFLIKSGLIATGGYIGARAVGNLVSPPFHLTPVVRTYEGDLQGKLAFSRNGSEYWQFLSIPYAIPPVRSLRFQAPIPAKRWYDVKKVLQYPPACVNFDSVVLMHANGVEDCLYLNVFVNPKESTVKKPVLVYIHGGGFFTGESRIYHPDYLMDHPIVVVTFNFRLGPLGFLNFEEKNDTKFGYPRGNMGLKDQNLVLQWIQRNIANFGGDPRRVTLMGESAGAASTHLHTLAPASRGLFHRAIAYSGTALCPWGFSNSPRTTAINYAKRIGCPTGSPTKLFECLMSMDARKLVSFQMAWSNPLSERDLFLPSIEPFETDDTFLLDSPENLLRSGKVAPVPLLLGVNSGEGGVRSARFQTMPELIPKLDKNWNALISRVLFQEQSIKPRVAEDIKQVYFRSTGRTSNDLQGFMENVTKLTGDVLFYEPVHRTAMEQSQIAPVFMLYYDYRSTLLPGAYSFYRAVKPQESYMSEMRLAQGLLKDWWAEHMMGENGVHRYGVGHGENLFQVWNINGFSKWFSDGDLKFSRDFINTIVEFMSGNLKSLRFQGTPWPPVSSGVLKNTPNTLVPYMFITDKGRGKLTEEPFAQRLRALERVFVK